MVCKGQSRLYRMVILITLAPIVLLACGTLEIRIERTPEPAAGATVADGIDDSRRTEPSPTKVSTSIPAVGLSLVPTGTLVQTPTPSSARIDFPSGTTSTRLEPFGIPAGSSVAFEIHAVKGQEMWVEGSPEDTGDWEEVGLTLVRVEDGVPLVLGQPGLNAWGGTIPFTGYYRVEVENYGDDLVVYHLKLTIPRRVRIEQGANSATIEGRIVNQLHNTYVLQAQAGRRIQVKVTSPNDEVVLEISGDNGEPFFGAQDALRSVSFVIDVTQDYWISTQVLDSLAGEAEVRYSLEVTVSD